MKNYMREQIINDAERKKVDEYNFIKLDDISKIINKTKIKNRKGKSKNWILKNLYLERA